MANLFTNMANRILRPAISKAREGGILPSRKESSKPTIGETTRRLKRKSKR
jgi:hypothetical protein